VRFWKPTPCKADRPGGAEPTKGPTPGAPTAIVLHIRILKKRKAIFPSKKSLENQEAFLPPGCCIPMVLHQCGDEKGAFP
jgi:hypothetical protein